MTSWTAGYRAKPRNTRPLIFVPLSDKTCIWLMSLFQSLSLISMNWPSVALNYVVTASSIPNNRSTTDSPCNGNRLSKIKISNGTILLYFQSPEGANCTLCWRLRTTISNLVRDKYKYFLIVQPIEIADIFHLVPRSKPRPPSTLKRAVTSIRRLPQIDLPDVAPQKRNK